MHVQPQRIAVKVHLVACGTPTKSTSTTSRTARTAAATVVNIIATTSSSSSSSSSKPERVKERLPRPIRHGPLAHGIVDAVCRAVDPIERVAMSRFVSGRLGLFGRQGLARVVEDPHTTAGRVQIFLLLASSPPFVFFFFFFFFAFAGAPPEK